MGSPPLARVDGRARVASMFSSRTPAAPTDVALLLGRLSLGWIFFHYGSGKLFAWFHGPGIHVTSLFFANTAHLRPGGFFAVFGGILEFGGGIALALGLLTRLAGLALFGDMVIATITVTWVNGFNSATPTPGYELNLAVGALALVFGFLGAGRLSLDEVISRRLSTGGP
ncbi:MAG TPA: DoxX family protein [Acidimicrobiales bacterium]|nr:DoxX family protein [Acidimicrobiales bacterium]